MGDQEHDVVIRISAKDLTELAAKSAQAKVSALAGATKAASAETKGLGQSVKGFFEAHKQSFTAIGQATGLLAGAIGGITAGIVALGVRGSTVAGVATSFDRLTAAAGESGAEMLRLTREGTKGLIANFDIMAAANKGLLLGLPITSTSMGDLAKTATVLGRAMKQDAGKSLDDLITALGRSSPLILDNLGLTVKVGEANTAYAQKLGKTVDQLTEAESKTAFYEAAMEAARVKVDELGGITLTFGDRIEQGKVKLQNLGDELGLAIANSPVLAAAMDGIGTAIDQAFGTDQSQRVKTLIGFVNDFAIGVVNAAQMGVTAAGVLHRGDRKSVV